MNYSFVWRMNWRGHYRAQLSTWFEPAGSVSMLLGFLVSVVSSFLFCCSLNLTQNKSNFGSIAGYSAASL